MGLIHWWPLNGDLYDRGSNPHHGTIVGAANVTTDGILGKCLSGMSGSQTTAGVSVANCNLVDELTDKNYSFACWFKVHGTHVHYNGTLMSSGNWNGDAWAVGIDQTNSKIDVFNDKYNKWINIGYTLTNNKWYHLVSVQQEGTNYIYLNGTLIGSVSATPLYRSNATNLCIGRETYASGHFSFNGDICDVRVYDHALSPAEVAELKRGLLVHYNFECGDNLSVEYDCSGHEYHATINGVTLSTDTAIGAHSSYYLNGQQWLQHDNAAYDANNLSVSMWIKSDCVSARTGYHIPFAIDGGRVEISIPNNGQLRWGGYIGGTRCCGNVTCENSAGATFSLLNGQWHHIVTTFDGTGWHGYVDGVYQDIQRGSGTISYTDKTLRIGKYTAGATSNYGATDMYIADVRVYNTTLTQADITSLYNHTVKVTPDQVMIGNYLTENNSDLNFQDLSVWKRTGHGERIRILEDGVELAAVNGWRNFALAVPSDMVGQNLIFSFDYKWNDNNRPYIGAWIWTNTSNSYTGSIYTLKYTTDDLPAGQWTHCSVPISAAKTYVGINNRVQDGSGMTAPLVLRNISLQLANNENVQVFPTGEVKCSRYGDSNKTRIIKAGNLTAETFVEI